MKCPKITLTLILFINTITISFAEESGFDEICTIYSEYKNSNMSIKVGSEYVFYNIKVRVSSADALNAHDAVMSAGLDVRYAIFKKSAEHYLKRKWECQSMEILMGM